MSNLSATPLQEALRRGLRPGGDLSKELRAMDSYPIHTRADAEAICDALSQLDDATLRRGGYGSPLGMLVALFQDVDGVDAPAFEVLLGDGVARLIQIFDRLHADASDDTADTLLHLLKILAMYGSVEGTQRIVIAARQPLRPDEYMWMPIFSTLRHNVGECQRVFDHLQDPIPPGFIAVSMLDAANHLMREGEITAHPFDSLQGAKQMEQWLCDRDPERFSFAHSATAGLPFLAEAYRRPLLAQAMAHPDVGVRVEAAWASAKLGDSAGFETLQRFCLEVNSARIARQYLSELGADHLIPPAANDPDFTAKAEFAQWLSHPAELGQFPDELEIIDHRVLRWPPEFEPMPFWLIRFRVRDASGEDPDTVGCGLVGSITWSFFDEKFNNRPLEEVYAIYCYWEMQTLELIHEAEGDEAAEYANMLNQWRGPALRDPCVVCVAELSPKLKQNPHVLAIASAHHEDQPVWALIDGEHSAMYPRQPDDSHDVTLRVHVGRKLLGLPLAETERSESELMPLWQERVRHGVE